MLACAGLAVLAAGCASTVPKWEKPGATQEATAADVQRCRLAAPREPHVQAPRTKMGMGGGFNSAVEQEGNRMRDEERYVSECMRARGYTDVSK